MPSPHLCRSLSVLLSLLAGRAIVVQSYTPPVPPVSPATSLPNKLYDWRHSQQIRYQEAGDPSSPHTAILVHGLFVNSDHWRHTLKGLADAGYRTYALDLWGCGYSSKPPRDSDVAKLVNGENDRFHDEEDMAIVSGGDLKVRGPSILRAVSLGTASGGSRVADVDLRHPLGSPYNFYTWGEQIADFTRDVVGATANSKATLVCNSIGTISSLQAILDEPDLYDGLFVVNPNFRELHSSEIPFPKFSMPAVRAVQKLLRERGQGLFDRLAKPDIVKQILKEPYAVSEAVDDTLVDVLLTPLLTEGASDVVFDTLSYSAGPLPEQQLSCRSFPKKKTPVWVCYGKEDPWTPPARVEALKNIDSVERVIGLDGVGHCPHDEDPDLVNPLLLEFMERVKGGKGITGLRKEPCVSTSVAE